MVKQAVEKLVSSAKISSSFNVRPEVNESWVVEFESEDDAFYAFEFLKGYSLDGRPVNVRLKLDSQSVTSPISQSTYVSLADYIQIEVRHTL
jgi:hypothetical protein